MYGEVSSGTLTDSSIKIVDKESEVITKKEINVS